jgi:dTDP-4-amino-4,6-dideoxygalactose transaminase
MLEARLDSTYRAPVRAARFPVDEPPSPASDLDPLSAFEAELARFVGSAGAAPSVIACDGHERALEFALRLAVEGHDPNEIEVVMPALGADAAARVALRLGAAVVPADVEQDTGNLSSRALAAAVGPRTRAVLVTHLFGHPATMPELLRLAEHHGLAVIEDISAALGAAHSGTPVGGSAAIAVLGGGEGHLLTSDGIGAVLVPSVEAERLVRDWRDATDAAPDEASLRLALAELRQAPEALHARRQAAWHLNYELRTVRGVSPMFHGRRARHGYDRYVARLRSVLWHRSTEETATALNAEGIPATVAVAQLLHEDGDVRSRLSDDPRLEAAHFRVASQLASEFIAVPLSGALSSEDMNDVAAAIIKVAAASERDAPELVR